MGPHELDLAEESDSDEEMETSRMVTICACCLQIGGGAMGGEPRIGQLRPPLQVGYGEGKGYC